MLLTYLEKNKDRILETWIDHTFQTYKPEMVKFLRGTKNQFANPVRATIVENLTSIYDGVLSSKLIDELYPELEAIIKLRSVQDFSPSNALSFVFFVKKFIREEVQKTEAGKVSSEELNAFEDKMDELIQLSFDIYSKCRQKVYEIRIAEIKAQSQRAFQLFEKQK